MKPKTLREQVDRLTDHYIGKSHVWQEDWTLAAYLRGCLMTWDKAMKPQKPKEKP